METNAVKSVGLDKPIIDIANNTEIKKPEQKQENISELLAGNNSDKKTEKSDNPKNGMSKKDIILNSIAITYLALFLFILTKPGEKFVNKLISNFIFKREKGRNIKRVKNLWKNRAAFKKIPFVKSNNIKEVKEMAKKLGIKKIKVEDLKNNEAINIYHFNTILSFLTDAHNKSKGRIRMPKAVHLENLLFHDGDACRSGIIRLSKDLYGTSLEEALCHELGHINHYPRTNIDMLDTVERATECGLSTKIAEEFSENIPLKQDIKRYISQYAATNPSEFIAETFRNLLGGVPVPKHILQKYAQYKGMVRLPAIRDFKAFRA